MFFKINYIYAIKAPSTEDGKKIAKPWIDGFITFCQWAMVGVFVGFVIFNAVRYYQLSQQEEKEQVLGHSKKGFYILVFAELIVPILSIFGLSW
ncbi:MAG: hypothetical protein ACLRQF_16395 [Thomasclavelia ramosa]